jgi:hypothetical protein
MMVHDLICYYCFIENSFCSILLYQIIKRVFVYISFVFILLLMIGDPAEMDVVSIEPNTSSIYDSTPKVKLQVSGWA